jgi:MYXO-CTERM domain-containing protein
MRHTAIALSTILAVLTLGGAASAHPAYYNQVIKTLNAQGCPPSTYDYVQGCANLCHEANPYDTGAVLPSPNTAQPFGSLLMNDFNWENYTNGQASTLVAPLDALMADTTFQAVVATVDDGCANPAAEIEAALNPAATGDGGAAGEGGVSTSGQVSLGGGTPPVYGCAMSPVGGATGASPVAAAGLGLGIALFARRRRRQAS